MYEVTLLALKVDMSRAYQREMNLGGVMTVN